MRKWGTILGVVVVVAALMFLSGHEAPPVAPGPEEPEAAGPAAPETPAAEPDEEAPPPPPQPTGPHTFAGRVVWEDGTPFGGSVVLKKHPWPVAEDGSFRVPGLAAGIHNFRLEDGDRFRSGSRIVWIPEESPLEVVLGSAWATVTGRVLSAENGRPVVGAVLTAVCRGPDYPQGGDIRVGATTDETGSFRMRVPPFEGRLRATAEGLAPHAALLSGTDEEIEFRLLPLAGVSGTVRHADTGAPVPGARVFAVFRKYGVKQTHEAVSDEEGAFAIRGLARGTHVVFAAGGGWISPGLHEAGCQGADRFAFKAEPGGAHRMEVTVVPAARFEGRVVSEKGGGVAGATITVTAAANSRGWGDDWLAERSATKTPADGSFTVPTLVPDHAWRFEAATPEGVSAGSEPVRAAAGETATVEITIPDQQWIDVTVRDAATGEPISGAKAWIRAQITPDRKRAVGQRPLTGLDGKARVGPVPHLPLEARAWHPDYLQMAEGIPVEGAAAVVMLSRGLEVRGRVSLPDGSPAGNGAVRVRPAVPGLGTGYGTRLVGPSGYFRIGGLSPASYIVSARATVDGRKHTGEATADAGGKEVAIALSPVEADPETERMEIAVRILGPDGEPILGGHLRWTTLKDGGYSSSGWPFLAGRIRVRAPEGRQFAQVTNAFDAHGQRLGGSLAGPLDVQGGEVTLRVGEERTITGRVVGPDGGVPGVVVGVSPIPPADSGLTTTNSVSTYTDPDGAFTLRGLGDLRYRLGVTASDAWSPPESMEVVAGSADVTIRLRPAARAVLAFLDARGEPVPGVRVAVKTMDGKYAFEDEASDENGRVVVTGLSPDAEYRLRYHAPDDRSDLWPMEDEIVGWRPDDWTHRFLAAWKVSGRVLDGRDRPAPGPHVWRRTDEGGWEWIASAGEGGTFTSELLPPGDLRVAVTPPGTGEPDREEPGVPVTQEADRVDLRVEMGPEIFVRVADWPADRGSKAHLIRASDGRRVNHVYVNGDGVIRFGRLDAEETYGIWSPCHGKAPRVLHLTGLRPGRDEIAARLKPAYTVAGRLFRATRDGSVRVSLSGPGYADQLDWLTHGDQFSFRCVPEGVWTLTVRAYIDGAWAEAARQVRAGETDLEIRMGK